MIPKNNRLTTRSAVALTLAGVLACASFTAQAATDTDTLSVTAQVAPVCEILGTSAVAFGALDPLLDNDNTGSITWQCTVSTSAEITLGGGGNNDAANRLMSDGGTNTLSYQLYTDAGRSAQWLDTATNGVAVTSVGYTGGAPVTVYGRVPQAAAATAANASYSDSVIVTITF